MGVERSITVGYGITIYEDEPPEALEDVPCDEEPVNAWLEQQGYVRIGFQPAGDFMCGDDQFYFFYIKDTQLTLGDFNLDGNVYEFVDEGELLALRELNHLAAILDYDGHIGWKLIGNVG